MSLSSFIDTIIVNKIANTSNNLSILDSININIDKNINLGAKTEIISYNQSSKIYHIYQNNIITDNNITPIKNIIDNYVYFFRNNYIYYLDKELNRIRLQRLDFNINDNNFEVIYDEFEENVYYFNILISCDTCNYIYINDTNNYVFLLLSDIDYIVVLDMTNITENYILLPSEKNYSEILVINNQVNIGNIEFLYAVNHDLDFIDFYSLDQNTYTLDFVQTKQFNHKIIKNNIYEDNIYTLCNNNELIINFNDTNKLHDITDILVNNYIIKNNNIELITPNQITTINIQDYKLNVLNNCMAFFNLENPLFIITKD
jgi:hypothetical protein